MSARRGPRPTSRPASRFQGWCEACGKRIYIGGQAARRAAKRIPGEHMSAYRCPHAPAGLSRQWWHLGHLPRDVVHGESSKADYVANVEARRRVSGGGAG